MLRHDMPVIGYGRSINREVHSMSGNVTNRSPIHGARPVPITLGWAYEGSIGKANSLLPHDSSDDHMQYKDTTRMPCHLRQYQN